MIVQRARPAMGSLFQLRLIGDDAEHLTAVADAALDEIERVERLLSWRDARSEAARINRTAAERPVLVDFEMADILATCLRAATLTHGYFNIAAVSRREPRPPEDLWQFDSARRLVRFVSPDVRLDFGAFGKGYALDCAARELRRFGIGDALLDGGTSSVLALGRDEHGNPWPIGLRNPFAARPDAQSTWPRELRQLRMTDLALSCSAVSDVALPQFGESDLVDPHTGRPPAEPAACAVVTRTAAAAEVLSTALLCMGKAGSADYTAGADTQTPGSLADVTAVYWLEPPPAEELTAGPRVVTLLDRSSGASP